jgi:hypothetical protein
MVNGHNEELAVVMAGELSTIKQEVLRIAGVKVGDTLAVPETYEEQEAASVPWVNNARHEANRLKLEGDRRVCFVNRAAVNVRDEGEEGFSVYATVFCRLPKKDGSWSKKETLMAVVECDVGP